jgi:hypothetical protein
MKANKRKIGALIEVEEELQIGELRVNFDAAGRGSVSYNEVAGNACSPQPRSEQVGLLECVDTIE